MSGTIWKDLSLALSGAVEAARPSLARVGASRRAPATGIVWSEGVIVTADHAIHREEGIVVGLEGGDVAATLVGRDPSTDLAVLRADLPGAKPAAWAEPASLSVGQLVLAVARPGKAPRATLGLVSALGEPFRTGSGGRIDRWIETDATLGRGFAGSALIGADGRVVGLGTNALRRGRALAIPVETVRRVAGALLERGRVERGWLGVGSVPVRLPEPLGRALGQSSGLLLLSVEPGSPAERAGLVLGDVVAAIDGHPTRHPGDLLEQLDAERIGRVARLQVVRAGEPRDMEVTIGTRAAA